MGVWRQSKYGNVFLSSFLKIPFAVFSWRPEEEVGTGYSGFVVLCPPSGEIWMPWVPCDNVGKVLCLVLASAAALTSHPRCGSLAKLSLTKDTLSLRHPVRVIFLMLTHFSFLMLTHSHFLISWLEHSRAWLLHGLGCFCRKPAKKGEIGILYTVAFHSVCFSAVLWAFSLGGWALSSALLSFWHQDDIGSPWHHVYKEKRD